MLRGLLGVVILGFLAYSGWWWLGSSAHQTSLEQWLDERRTAGWIATYDDLSVGGYPNRIDTTVVNLELADPTSGWAWRAPKLQVLSLSYKPNHVIAAFPETQRLSSTQNTYDIATKGLKASVVFAPNTALTLDRTRLSATDITVTSQKGDTHLSAANFATNALGTEDAPDFAHEIGLDLQALSLPQGLLQIIDPRKRLPQVIETVHLDALAAFDAPWDRAAFEGRKPQLTALRLRDVHATWGEIMISAVGRTKVDKDGFLQGEITIKARNWRAMVDLLEASGVIPRDLARTVRRGLGLMAGLRGGDELEVPLEFADGGTYLGPIPIGRAPRITIR